jgi:hypothetical protein
MKDLANDREEVTFLLVAKLEMSSSGLLLLSNPLLCIPVATFHSLDLLLDLTAELLFKSKLVIHIQS